MSMLINSMPMLIQRKYFKNSKIQKNTKKKDDDGFHDIVQTFKKRSESKARKVYGAYENNGGG